VCTYSPSVPTPSGESNSSRPGAGGEGDSRNGFGSFEVFSLLHWPEVCAGQPRRVSCGTACVMALPRNSARILFSDSRPPGACAFWMIEFHLFLMSLSVRLGMYCSEIWAHFVPISCARSQISWSSSGVHSPLNSSGRKWLRHLSRHCLPFLSWRRVAIAAQLSRVLGVLVVAAPCSSSSPLGDELLFVLRRRVGQEALSTGFFAIGLKRNLRGLASFCEVLVQV